MLVLRYCFGFEQLTALFAVAAHLTVVVKGSLEVESPNALVMLSVCGNRRNFACGAILANIYLLAVGHAGRLGNDHSLIVMFGRSNIASVDYLMAIIALLDLLADICTGSVRDRLPRAKVMCLGGEAIKRSLILLALGNYIYFPVIIC